MNECEFDDREIQIKTERNMIIINCIIISILKRTNSELNNEMNEKECM